MTKKIFTIIFFLSISFIMKSLIYTRVNVTTSEKIKFERIRSAIAAELWHKADELMHKGSINQETQKFKAGSYVGNTDIIPLLKAIIALKPNEILPYRILAQSLIYSEKNSKHAENVLLQGIKANKDLENVHELYASLGFTKMIYGNKSSNKDYFEAISCFEKAIKHYKKSDSNDYFFNLENYKIMISRIYIEINQPEKAIKILEEAGISLYSSEDMVFKYLREYKLTGKTNKEIFKEENYEISQNKEYNTVNQEHFHEDIKENNSHIEIKKSLLSNPFIVALKSGILLILILLFAYYKKPLISEIRFFLLYFFV